MSKSKGDRKAQKIRYERRYPEKTITARARQLQARMARNKALIDGFKSRPCKDCQRAFPTECMDFDHLGDKFKGVAKMWNMSPVTIMKEIAKCEVVCSNCHRIRTARRKAERFHVEP